ncbi:MAG: type II toxin-antitoxin system RelE/ParE family toxin [Arcobacteraceae bacterium]
MMIYLQRLNQNMYIKYSEQSILDLNAIIEYISKDSVRRALSYADFLKTKIEILISSPYIGVECRHKKVYQDCRVYIVDSYLVFYTVQESTIIIRRILNSAVNYIRKEI